MIHKPPSSHVFTCFLPLAFDDGKEKVDEFDSYVNTYIMVAGQRESPAKEQKDYERRLRETKTFLINWKEELILTNETTSATKNNAEIPHSKEIFIVHGHDVIATLELENLLRRLKLNPIILHRQPDKGEKQESYLFFN